MKDVLYMVEKLGIKPDYSLGSTFKTTLMVIAQIVSAIVLYAIYDGYTVAPIMRNFSTIYLYGYGMIVIIVQLLASFFLVLAAMPGTEAEESFSLLKSILTAKVSKIKCILLIITNLLVITVGLATDKLDLASLYITVLVTQWIMVHISHSMCSVVRKKIERGPYN